MKPCTQIYAAGQCQNKTLRNTFKETNLEFDKDKNRIMGKRAAL